MAQVGESARESDMDVNPVREKKLTNVRSAGNDEKVRLPASRNTSSVWLLFVLRVIGSFTRTYRAQQGALMSV